MNQYHKHQTKGCKLVEGLRKDDLKDMIDHLFTIDQYQSKMGDDKNTLVLRFRAASKEPAIDLMEFIEKGYSFVLDADTSSGEEKDGSYSVFVELERTEHAPEEIKDLLSGIGQLCGCTLWKFRWYRDTEGHKFDVKTAQQVIPLTPEAYETRVGSSEAEEISEFFDQGAIDDITLENNIVTFRKPFAEALSAKVIAIGDYNVLKNALRGGLQLDESSRSQVTYLNKYLGNYDINKIENHFLIRNGDRAIILAKDRW